MISEHERRSSDQGNSFVKIRFPLSEEDSRQGVEAENLWAHELGQGRYLLDNIPFYVYGVSCDDIVAADRVEDRLTYRDVVERGGHSTYRVLITSNTGFEDPAFARLWTELESLGCRYEIAKLRLVTIDVPQHANADSAYAILQRGEVEGVWSFEEAHCGHPL